jgi:hypothetical protein
LVDGKVAIEEEEDDYDDEGEEIRQFFVIDELWIAVTVSVSTSLPRCGSSSANIW